MGNPQTKNWICDFFFFFSVFFFFFFLFVCLFVFLFSKKKKKKKKDGLEVSAPIILRKIREVFDC